MCSHVLLARPPSFPRRQRVHVDRSRNRSESALPRDADSPRFQLDNPITAILVSLPAAKTVGEATTLASIQSIVVAAGDGRACSGCGTNRRDAGLAQRRIGPTDGVTSHGAN